MPTPRSKATDKTGAGKKTLPKAAGAQPGSATAATPAATGAPKTPAQKAVAATAFAKTPAGGLPTAPISAASAAAKSPAKPQAVTPKAAVPDTIAATDTYARPETVLAEPVSTESNVQPAPAERDEMIRVLAFELFQRRSPDAGSEIDDWLMAEQRVHELLSKGKA